MPLPHLYFMTRGVLNILNEALEQYVNGVNIAGEVSVHTELFGKFYSD